MLITKGLDIDCGDMQTLLVGPICLVPQVEDNLFMKNFYLSELLRGEQIAADL